MFLTTTTKKAYILHVALSDSKGVGEKLQYRENTHTRDRLTLLTNTPWKSTHPKKIHNVH